MKATTISSIMLAVAVLVTGCHKAQDKNGMGPAQSAGKAIDDTGAKAAA
jgi:colicin import membrane protein